MEPFQVQEGNGILPEWIQETLLALVEHPGVGENFDFRLPKVRSETDFFGTVSGISRVCRIFRRSLVYLQDVTRSSMDTTSDRDAS